MAASTITRTSGSVPDGRSSTRPVSPSSASAALTAALTSGAAAPACRSATGTLIITWGSLVTTEARSASDRPVAAIRAISCRPVRMPSPVVACAGSTMCPLCSPPNARPRARSSSSTYRSPTLVSTSWMPASRMASFRPRLLITVATRVLSVKVPASRMASARIAMISSPSTSSPLAVTARHRSASPSWAMPRSAPCRSTAARNGSRWVDPQPSLMLSPSGAAWIAMTSAPASRYAAGAASEAAPFAQSTTTRSPSRRCPVASTRCLT